MGAIDACCWGPFGSRCCNIISLLGFIYFGFNFLLFESQKNFYEFHMEDPQATKTSILVCSLLYLFIFGVTLVRIIFLNKQKTSEKKHMQSIHQSPKPLQTMAGTKIHSVKQLMVEEDE